MHPLQTYCHSIPCVDLQISETAPRAADGTSNNNYISSLVVRLLRFIRIVRVANLLGVFRKFISRNKARYTQDGFDLDLTYVTKELIAMSLPAIGAEAHYRNPITEVRVAHC